MLDVGGSHVKIAFSGQRTEIKVPTGPRTTPERMMRGVLGQIRDRPFDAATVGYPGFVVHGRIAREPAHLGSGWIGYDFQRRLGRPTRVVNDAAMQAMGSYRGGRMLYLGLGTGLGSAMIADGRLLPMELAHLPYKKEREYEEYVGEAALERLGRRKWQREVYAVVDLLYRALEPDYVTLGGGNTRKLKELPPYCQRGDNRDAIVGGARIWEYPVDESAPALRARRSATRPN